MIGVEKYVEIKTNGVDSIEGQPVPTRDPVVQTLNVTPLKTAQTFNAPSGVDGFNPVNISAVTSSIDSNITAGNIKDGVTILGVQGNYTGSGATIESLGITPTTSEQTITASGSVDGYSPITVSAVTSSIDANITAENIKSGVTILGVTGTAEIAPRYYIEKTVVNGWLSNTNKLIDFSGITALGNGVLCYQYYYSTFPANTTIDLSSVTNITGTAACGDTFYYCSGIKTVDLSNLTQIIGLNSCSGMFYSCPDLTSVDLGSLERINGQGCASQMFLGCYSLSNLDISSLNYVNGYGACQGMFQNCISLTSIDIGSLTTLDSNATCQSMFYGCTGITSVDISSLTTINGYSACQGIFGNCTSLTSITFTSLNSIKQTNIFQTAFRGCTSLTSVSFPALTSTSFGSYTNQFTNMLQDVTGCTVHFPSNLQSVIGSWTDVTNGFGGTNTTVLFDLTATE